MRIASLLILLGLFTISACSSSSSSGGLAPCSDAGSCENGFVCTSGVCLPPSDGGSGTGGNAGANTGGNAGASGGVAGAAGASPSGGAAGAGGALGGSGGGGPTCDQSPSQGGIATAGVSCDANGSTACAGNAQAQVLECDVTSCTWKSGTSCPIGQLCDSKDASCKNKMAGCTAGGAVCINGVRHVCGPDLVTTTASPCPATAPQCTGAGTCVGCTVATDCPAPSNPCQKAMCNSGTCGSQAAPSGTSCGSNKTCSAGSCNCVSGYQDCDGNGSSCESYVASDASNCGTCGKSCGGGSCSGGVCQATTVISVTNLSAPIAVDGGYVYYADNSSIRRVLVSGGGGTYLAASGGTVRGLAVDSSYVYWANLNDVFRAPKGGGSISLLSTLTDGSTIALTSYDVYFADVIGGNIWSVPKTGGSPLLIASGQVQFQGGSLSLVFSDIAGDNGNVVWSLDGNSLGTGAVRRAGPFGGSVSTLASAARPAAVALDGGKVYYVDGDSGVYSRDLSVPGVSTLASWSTGRYVTDLMIDASYAYVISAPPAAVGTLVERVSKLGGSLQLTAQGSGSYPGHFAQDSQAIYYSTASAIHRVPK